MATSTIKRDIKIETVSGTTSSAGILFTDIPFDRIINACVATKGKSWYANVRQSSSGFAVVYIWDQEDSSPIANTAVDVNVSYI